ncbi:endonuclease/exonuclease/phosphatase family protein [candidate division KSB1 bacterium]|nr:endonuclease/exonuclease/phosphatase family protein [candidate division KSB1 bacterium]
MRKKRFIWWLLPGLLLLFLACEPLVTQFEERESGEAYTAKQLKPAPTQVDTLIFMTWNIRFGAADARWFGDCCGHEVILDKNFVIANLQRIADKIEAIHADIVLLQEVDVLSKRTGYINQVQWLLDHTSLNYAAYGSMWQAQYVPSDGLGRVDAGQATLSRWPITENERIQLQQRGDQDALTRYFYLRRNILKTKIALPGLDNFYVLNVHPDAFATDNTKKIQLETIKAELDLLNQYQAHFVCGGDFNSLPPGTLVTDFCMQDKCDDESFHGPNDDPQHKPGSYFTPETDWMQPMYDTYYPAVPLDVYVAHQTDHFTHTPDPQRFWDRKLDYLFSNQSWVPGTFFTHQEAMRLSDHAPVSAKWEVPK